MIFGMNMWFLEREKTIRLLRSFICLLAASCYLAMHFAVAESPSLCSKVRSIEVKGNKRIPDSTIVSYLKIDTNTPYSREKVDQGINYIYETGLFSDVSVNCSTENGKLTVFVKENPTVDRVAIEGNKKIQDKELKEHLNISDGSVYTRAAVNKDINTILNIYQQRGWYLARVESNLVVLPDDRVTVIFDIKEGKKAKINKLLFIGNDAFSDEKLKRVLVSREFSPFRFFSSADLYDKNRLELDAEVLKSYYKNNGYAGFQILNIVSELSSQKEYFIVTFVVNEGPQYRVGDVVLENALESISQSKLMSLIHAGLKRGEIFKEIVVQNVVAKLTAYLEEKGYAFVDIVADYDKDAKNGILNIKFVIKEGPRFYINAINIRNNVRTQWNVIGREIRIYGGDPFNMNRLENAKQRLMNLGYFSSVDLSLKPTNVSDKVDVDFTIDEMSTGSCGVNFGYNTTGGVMGGFSISENNLLGTGRILSLDLQKATRMHSASLNFVEPHFMNYNMFGGIELFSTGIKTKEVDPNNTSYTRNAYGTVLKMGYELTEYLSHSVRYSLQSEYISGISSMTSPLIRLEAGRSVASSVGHTLIYDRRNSTIDPVRGYVLKLNQDIAGLGGSSRFFRNEFSTAYYVPFIKNNLILSFVGRLGSVDGLRSKQVRIYNNFFLGEETIRGFEPEGIGPRDTQYLDALGGKKYYSGTIEATFPVGLPKEMSVRGVAFTDAASLWGLDVPLEKSTIKISSNQWKGGNYLRMSYGVGVIWNSPLGVIRLDYGIPIRKTSYDQTSHLRISMGVNNNF